MARGKDESRNLRRRVDLETIYERRAYDELVRRGDVTHLDLPVADHPNFNDMILPTAKEMMQTDAADVERVAREDDPETNEERNDRLGK